MPNTVRSCPDVTPVQDCYLGWQESPRNLAKLVEPDITQ